MVLAYGRFMLLNFSVNGPTVTALLTPVIAVVYLLDVPTMRVAAYILPYPFLYVISGAQLISTWVLVFAAFTAYSLRNTLWSPSPPLCLTYMSFNWRLNRPPPYTLENSVLVAETVYPPSLVLSVYGMLFMVYVFPTQCAYSTVSSDGTIEVVALSPAAASVHQPLKLYPCFDAVGRVPYGSPALTFLVVSEHVPPDGLNVMAYVALLHCPWYVAFPFTIVLDVTYSPSVSAVNQPLNT